MNYNFGAGPQRWSLSFPGRSARAAGAQEARGCVCRGALLPRVPRLRSPLPRSRLRGQQGRAWVLGREEAAICLHPPLQRLLPLMSLSRTSKPHGVLNRSLSQQAWPVGFLGDSSGLALGTPHMGFPPPRSVPTYGGDEDVPQLLSTQPSNWRVSP